jgi:DNA modification methylase
MKLNEIIQGDCLDVLKSFPDESVDCCVTSPPYWGLRDYGVDGQLGAETTPELYVENLVSVFGEVKRVLKKEGTLWLNLGDSYAAGKSGRDDSGSNGRFGGERLEIKQRKAPKGFKTKDLVGIPWMTAFALRANGWYLRQDIIWAKPNPMPESVTDRCTKSHEYVFLMSKNKDYFYDADAIKEKSVYSDPRMVDGFGNKSINGKHKDDPQNSANRKQYTPDQAGGGTSMMGHDGYFKANGEPIGTPGMRNKRDVWTVTTSPFPEAHFATYPEELIAPMILAGCPAGGVVLDPFMGAGTTGLVAAKLGRNYLGVELNPEYIEIANRRIAKIGVPLFL